MKNLKQLMSWILRAAWWLPEYGENEEEGNGEKC